MKLNRLDQLIQEIDETSSNMQELSRELRVMFTTTDEQKYEEKEVSFNDLRALCINRSREGLTEAIKDVILEEGAKKLSEVEPSRYNELYHRVEALK